MSPIMKWNCIIICFLSLLLSTPSIANAKRLHPEKWYQDRWCAKNGGKAEVVLPDKTRCDCIVAENAVEVEFANKWAESIGQSLYYSLQTGKRAGIVLIIENDSDQKYWIRLNSTIQHFKLPIDTWSVKE